MKQNINIYWNEMYSNLGLKATIFTTNQYNFPETTKKSHIIDNFTFGQIIYLFFLLKIHIVYLDVFLWKKLESIYQWKLYFIKSYLNHVHVYFEIIQDVYHYLRDHWNFHVYLSNYVWIRIQYLHYCSSIMFRWYRTLKWSLCVHFFFCYLHL